MAKTSIIDGLGPLPVHRPASLAELSECVRQAAAKGEAIYPVGGGTALDLGGLPTRSGVIVTTEALNEVDDYPARDTTITVGAGITIGELQTLLAREKQYLPVDLYQPADATLGGVMAANLSGPRRLAQGTLRDFVIGIQVVSDSGAVVRGGGRVVKNVAGYDLMKLHIGALGSLGVITQATLKVKPRPETQAAITFGIGTAALGPTLDRLHASPSRPAIVEVLNAQARRQLPETVSPATVEPWLVICGFEEKTTTVNWQVQTLLDELTTAPVRDVQALPAAVCDPLWAAITELQRGAAEYASLKAIVPPSQTAAIATAALNAHPEAAVHTHAGNGIVFVHVPLDRTPDRLSRIIAELSRQTVTANANVIVLRCPAAWKAVLPIWGVARADRVLMKAIRASLDPGQLFNPGRLF